MSIRKSLMTLAALALLATGQNANAGLITGLFNTGAGVAPGGTDTHYSISSTPYTGLAQVETNVPPPYATSPLSSWISTPGNPSNAAVGVYNYSTTFNDTDNTGIIKGNLASDDTVTIFLNGNQVSPLLGNEFTTFTSFTITSGFLQGANTLLFVVNNIVSYEGLNVNYTAVVPEPASMGMVALGLGVAGFVGVRRNRRRTV